MFWIKYVLGKLKNYRLSHALELEEAENANQKCTANRKWIYVLCQFAYKVLIVGTVTICSLMYRCAVQVENF